MARRIWVAGHNGMVGSAIVRQLKASGETVLSVSRQDLDLRDQGAVTSWLLRNRPDAIIFAAAKVGGILANDTLPADFIYDNLILEANVINGAHQAGVDRLVFLGSSCIYPRMAAQPIKEESLLSGPLEPTNEWYAVAKIAGIKLCQAYRKQYGRKYISVMPCNLYGPRDNFDLKSSHVLPALVHRFHLAKIDNLPEVVVWGTGQPLREFLHVDDLANGVVFCLDNYDEYEHINCGSGLETSIKDLAHLVRDVVGYEGALVFDETKPDGTPRKVMDSSRMRALGWKPVISLEDGVRHSYQWFLDNYAAAREAA
ncbi:bifunctional GDP-fucose synthetase: GDP-4-dehydro-6-deoxy-D-mannose epimerase and GDP-4-dehydro-6-L-deoxygalactose reductase [Beijerinckiaceae bacterium RH AL1]|nr:GDP-L-fucose synthase [Beijerinckiaceae bacterium]VVB42784.1 bifunctional GDP-fucose synthetase: GDP-4-dehydro-6-deoxy-D-mannose epimerase and GDP-4-dehydro-6-L-deoxygalactose reductase [Beijerinckiaceae bacterium RH AL8]VVB42795.1 bifunctional GDP-fucose synthetase: GDP-4-dehydro-6-deoxy-D-mannose epimerase and GDP-4-dehydro-6-L-deoxygalactose reductase [Beijerinckiaceae bacterium RH CH11]VVC53501.1 bifunctional GDP-fucose synthetase: GDP-4-dehydro-6-deoxy-D-mannose epimerase and GDP-4-dehyd